MNASLLEFLDRLTPVQCYVVARRLDSRGRRISASEIARATGLSLQQVSWIGHQKTWRNIPVGQAEAFMRGCGITLTNRCRHLAYIKRTGTQDWPLAHLSHLRTETRRRILKSLE
jgi:hypothetical protein